MYSKDKNESKKYIDKGKSMCKWGEVGQKICVYIYIYSLICAYVQNVMYTYVCIWNCIRFF